MSANRAAVIIGTILLLFLCLHTSLATAKGAEKVQGLRLKVGEQRSISAKGIAKYSEGKAGIIDVRLPDDGLEFIVVGVAPGSSILLCITDEGEKLHYRFDVVADTDEVPKRENIRLDFYFVELRSGSNMQFGVNWPNSVGTDASLDFDIRPGGIAAASAKLSSLPLPRLDILHAKEWAKISQQASVIVTTGEKALFRSGGEVNLAVQGSLAAELRQIPFGTDVEVWPRFDRKTGRLELRVNAEVAALGPGKVPTRTRSSIDTVVNIEPNQAIVLAGLRSRSKRRGKSGLPYLSQIPVLGTLFGSHGRAEEESQNVIFIVPSIVDLVDADARAQLSSALDAFRRFDGDMPTSKARSLLGESR